MIANRIFKDAVLKAYQLDMEELPKEEELNDIHVFSEEFIDNIKKIDKYAKHKYFSIKGKMIRGTTAIAISIFMVLSVSLSVESIRTPLINYVVTAYEKYSSIIFKNDEDKALPTTIEENYILTYIPQDYKLIDETNLVNIRELAYVDSVGNYLVFEQYTVDNMDMTIDTEGVEIKKVQINSYEGILYTNKEITTVIWNNGRYGFSIYGKLNEDLIIEMAKSTRIKNK